MNIEDLKKSLLNYESYLKNSENLINIELNDKDLNYGIDKIKKDREICQEKISDLKKRIKSLEIKESLMEYTKEALVEFIIDKLGNISDNDIKKLDNLSSGKKVSNSNKNVSLQPSIIIKDVEKHSKKTDPELDKMGNKTHDLYSNFLKLEKEYKELELKINKEKDITIKNRMKDKSKILDYKVQVAWEEYQQSSNQYKNLIDKI